MEINDINSALKAYNALTDARDKLRRKYEGQEGQLKDMQEGVEQYLLEEMKRLGFTSIEVPGEGIAAIKTKRHFGGADWGLIWQWVVDNKCPEVLQKRLLDSAIATYLETHGDLPPGVSSRAEQVIGVTKRPK